MSYLDFLLNPLISLDPTPNNPIFTIFLIASIIAFFIVLLQKILIDYDRMAELQAEMKELQVEARAAQQSGDPKAMAKVQKKGLVRIFNAYKYSMKGFKAGIENEAAIRQELVLAAIMTVAAFFIFNSAVELVLLVVTPWIVVITELLNSAVEAVVDRIGPEFHELSGRAKDLGSAAVFVALGVTLFTWGAIIAERLVA